LDEFCRAEYLTGYPELLTHPLLAYLKVNALLMQGVY